ncbi:MAG: methylated-DNA--[protein]-cysteine S-methyltransferase [Actinomycetota bacterium]|nr:methylated-DNA--[protein]-cysteine S-methyltransferase [Actinomycetota bacterium]
MNIEVVRVETPVGWFTAEVADGAVRRAGFDEWGRPSPGAPGVLDALVAYFGGELDALGRIRVDVQGTSFQERVWKLLREIPPGQTRSYGDLADDLGVAGAARAVGMANASNPVGVIVPCHRVVRSTGAIGGYAGGVERKRWLLDHESRARHLV